jgi:hypothetical protein
MLKAADFLERLAREGQGARGICGWDRHGRGALVSISHQPRVSYMDAPSSRELDRRVIEGWSALEHGDLEGARAALRDVYEANPVHPALPLLAAGIRRARGRRIPWRAVVVLGVLISGGAIGARAWMGARSAPPMDSATAADAKYAAPAASPTVPSPPAQPMESSAEAGATSGRTVPTVPSGREPATRAPAESTPPATDEAQIRQAISRFASVYGSRWTRLALGQCSIVPTEDSAVATCHSGATQRDGAEEPGGVWTFSCRKVAGLWKIVSIQPPTGLASNPQTWIWTGTALAFSRTGGAMAQPDDDMTTVPLPSSETDAEHDRIRRSNDRDQRLEREGKDAPHNRGYDEAADGTVPPGGRG